MIIVLNPKPHSNTLGCILFKATKKELKEMIDSNKFSMDEVNKTYPNSQELIAVKMAKSLMANHKPTAQGNIVANDYWNKKYT